VLEILARIRQESERKMAYKKGRNQIIPVFRGYLPVLYKVQKFY
jgi:hypothetical protein